MNLHTFISKGFDLATRQKYRVELETLTPEGQTAKAIGHHILVVDRSGSMWGSMDQLKATLTKLLNISEFQNEDLKVSLISYSSQGDCTLHFEGLKVSDPTATQKVQTLQASCLTCISQGLKMAIDIASKNPDETCAISLHTDGWANDRSPSTEARVLAELSEQAGRLSNVVINTIAYGGYSDFNLLSSIANKASGVCVQAGNIKQVYDALETTHRQVAGKMVPALPLVLKGAEYLLVVDDNQKRVLAYSEDTTLRGCKAGESINVLRFYPDTNATGDALPQRFGAAFSRALLSLHRVAAAKFAMVGVGDPDLFTGHAKALTNTQLAAFATALEDRIFQVTPFATGTLTPPSGATLVEVLAALSRHLDGFTLNLTALQGIYQARSVKRVDGTREADGTVTLPRVKTAFVNKGDFVQVSGFDFNRTTATINMRTVLPIALQDRATSVEVQEIAGVKIAGVLKTFRNYTIVGDGNVTVDNLVINVTSKALVKELNALGCRVQLGECRLDLTSFPLVPYGLTFEMTNVGETLKNLAYLKVLESILSASQKGEGASTEKFTAEQIEALKEFYLSGELNVSLPSTNPYTDLDEAIKLGQIDSFPRYEIELGTPELTSLSKIKSANAFLERAYTVGGAADAAKPKVPDLLRAGAVVARKVLGARVKWTTLDELQATVFDEVFALKPLCEVPRALAMVGIGTLPPLALGKPLTPEVNTFAKQLGSAVEDFYRANFSTLAFYVGASGLLPDNLLDLDALDADQLAARFPQVSLAKDEKEGTFYVLPGDVILSVTTTSQYFSTGR
jgi:Mg-chelatase subunit ChlD